MFDVLVYLYENYLHAGECPTEDHLVLKLSAAGFEDDDISDALAWLAELNVSTGNLPRAAQGGPATRIYTATEEVCLDTACRGLLCFLEGAGVLDAVSREIVIEQACAMPLGQLNLHRLKVIVMMVLWLHERSSDAAAFNALLIDYRLDGAAMALH